MARISGHVGAGPVEPGLVDRMLLAARTLDTWHVGTIGVEPITLGWTGLGAPSLTRSCGVIVALDGRLYLGGGVECVSGSSDAEIIAERHGRLGFAAAVASLDGDFAVALYDPQQDTLWLARDRFGVRPLYYARHGGSFAFASQPRSLFEIPGVSRQPRREYLALVAAGHYRHFDARPHASPYEDIAQLPAAHVLQFHSGQVSVRPYWSLEEHPDLVSDEAALAAGYRERLLDSVRRRFVGAEAPAFTLSGGMDSSSVLAVAVAVSGGPVEAFSVVYDDPTFDERSDIEPFVGELVREWHPISVGTPDVFGYVRRMIEAHDEPVATATWLSHFILCEEASRLGFRTLFGGLGGDELNAGEYEHFVYHFADLRVHGRERDLHHEVESWIAHHDHPVHRKSFAVVEEAFTRLVDLGRPGRCVADRRRLERYASALDPGFFRLEEYEPPMDGPFTSYLKNRSYHDIVRETVPCCLRAQGRHGDLFSLDHIVPFFDRRLAEFMFAVPGEMKIKNGVSKVLLREATRGLLPEATRTRVKKTGWNAPAHRWFAGKGAEQLLDLVRSRSFRERGIFDLAEVERLIREHDAIVRSEEMRENHMMFLWQLLNVELWLQQIDRASAT